MNGRSRYVRLDHAAARDYFRQAAEKLSNEAMLNLAELHGSLQEFEVAARWADTAVRFGFPPAEDAAKKFRELAALRPAVTSVDPVTVECLDEAASIARMAPATILRDKEPPSLENLRSARTPYVQRLCEAKEAMLDAASYLEEDEVVMCAAYAVQAHRVPDSALIFSARDQLVSQFAAEAMLAMDVPLDEGLALLLQPPDPAAVVSYYGSLHRRFPDDYALATRAARTHMFETLPGRSMQEAIRLFDGAFSLLPHPDDDKDPLTIDLLSMVCRAHFEANNMPKAKTFLSRFVEVGARDGHRKVPEARFQLGLIALLDNRNGSMAKKRKSFQVAVDHLHAGRAFMKTLPEFLQPPEPSGSERMLANLVRTISLALDLPIDDVSADCEASGQNPQRRVVRGGEVVPGPRRHEKLRRERSRLLQVLKTARLPIAKMMAKMQSKSDHSLLKWTTPPPPKNRQSGQQKRPASSTPAIIDELFSALRDQIYEGRSLQCVVVAAPCSTGSSYSVLVEDSQREPAIVAVYNASKHVVDQLVPGRVLHIADPYVRLATDQSILVRVDNPSGKLRVGDLHETCWNCSIVHDTSDNTSSLRSCAKCQRAKYCSRECQKEDWQEFGHRYLCG